MLFEFQSHFVTSPEFSQEKIKVLALFYHSIESKNKKAFLSQILQSDHIFFVIRKITNRQEVEKNEN